MLALFNLYSSTHGTDVVVPECSKLGTVYVIDQTYLPGNSVMPADPFLHYTDEGSHVAYVAIS